MSAIGYIWPFIFSTRVEVIQNLFIPARTIIMVKFSTKVLNRT